MKLRLQAFHCAAAGISHLFRTQPHARWHFLAMALVVITGIFCKVRRMEWLALLLAMGLVWTAEACNTAIELACDAITREQHPLIGRAKDVAAGAVLLAALFAALVGAMVFAPRLLGSYP